MDWDQAFAPKVPMDFGDGGCQKRVNVWKQANAKLQQDFNEVARQRDVIAEQRDAWAATVRKLFDEGKVNASKEEILSIFRETEAKFLADKGLEKKG